MMTGDVISTAGVRFWSDERVSRWERGMTYAPRQGSGWRTAPTSTQPVTRGELDYLTGFLRVTAATNLEEPVVVQGNRVHMVEKQMDPEKPYTISYGKGTFIIRKAQDDKIHVYRLP